MWIARTAFARNLVGSSLVLTVIQGCKNDDSAQSTSSAFTVEKPAVKTQAVATAAGAAVAAAQSKYDEAAFSLEMAAPANVKAGEVAAVTLTLVPKAPFHVNAEYPHRFKVASLLGATTPAPIVNRDPAKLSPAKLVIEIPITAVQAGTVSLDGEAALSVCTDEKCLMEKRQLKTTFRVN